MNYFYHVTPISNYDSIMEFGLIPKIGERSKLINDEKGIYLFHQYEDCLYALMNWLGEEYEDTNEKLITLRISLPDGFPLVITCEWERMSLVEIPPPFIEFYKEEGDF